MASQTFSLKLRNRSTKQAIKWLPESVELPRDATVEQAKILIAKQVGVSDYNRIGLFDKTTNRTLKDKNARLSEIPTVANAGEVLVKDLGVQLGYRTVFVVEYLGPLLFHSLFFAARPYIYGRDAAPLTDIQVVSFALFMLHFVKRELETLFLHRFSANTVPAWNIFRNSFFYWVPAGLHAAFVIYAPKGYRLLGVLPVGNVVRSGLGPLDYLGLALYAVGEVCNLAVHVHLAGLRSPGSTERKIPNCIGSSLVTCPNYMFEVMAWVGVILITRSYAVVIFIYYGIIYMRSWSRDKEKALRQQFPDKYKKKRYTMLPGLI